MFFGFQMLKDWRRGDRKYLVEEVGTETLQHPFPVHACMSVIGAHLGHNQKNADISPKKTLIYHKIPGFR